MEKTFLSLVIKVLAMFLASWIAFGLINNNTLLWVFIVALTVSIVGFLIGDLLILPKYSHGTATIANGVFAVITSYVIDLLSPNFNMTWVSGLVF